MLCWRHIYKGGFMGQVKMFLFSLVMVFISGQALAEITACEPGTGMLFVRGEPARGIGSFCISQNVYRASGQDWAATGCGLRSHLCATSEYVQACLTRVIPETPGFWHHTSEFGIGGYSRIQLKQWGGAKENSCLSVQNVFPVGSTGTSPTLPFRCCQR